MEAKRELGEAVVRAGLTPPLQRTLTAGCFGRALNVPRGHKLEGSVER